MPNARYIQEVPYGTYVWEMPDGRWVADDQGNYMGIFCMQNDAKAVAQLVQAARAHGIRTGKPVFLDGARQIDDEEYEHQKQRMAWGLIPDPQDAAALAEERRAREIDRDGRRRGRQ